MINVERINRKQAVSVIYTRSGEIQIGRQDGLGKWSYRYYERTAANKKRIGRLMWAKHGWYSASQKNGQTVYKRFPSA